MHTRATFNQSLIIGGICLLTLSMVQILPALPNQETNVSLETAVQTALRENAALNAMRKKVRVARARIAGIALLDNPKLETEFAGGTGLRQGFELTQTFQLGGATRTSETDCWNAS